jgi:ABC-type antimicrobial peptide transport system permease subunit
LLALRSAWLLVLLALCSAWLLVLLALRSAWLLVLLALCSARLLLVICLYLSDVDAPILLSFGAAFTTGVLFGFWPARKASRLDPVVALSSE